MAVGPVPQPEPPQPEPGYTTTEFYIALATSVIGLLIAFHVVSFTNDQTQGILGVVTLVAPAVAYIVSRGIRKLGL